MVTGPESGYAELNCQNCSILINLKRRSYALPMLVFGYRLRFVYLLLCVYRVLATASATIIM